MKFNKFSIIALCYTKLVFASELETDPLENSPFGICPAELTQQITFDYLDVQDIYHFTLSSKKLIANVWKKDVKIWIL